MSVREMQLQAYNIQDCGTFSSIKTIFKLLLEDSKAHVNLKKNVKISSEQANKLI